MTEQAPKIALRNTKTIKKGDAITKKKKSKAAAVNQAKNEVANADIIMRSQRVKKSKPRKGPR